VVTAGAAGSSCAGPSGLRLQLPAQCPADVVPTQRAENSVARSRDDCYSIMASHVLSGPRRPSSDRRLRFAHRSAPCHCAQDCRGPRRVRIRCVICTSSPSIRSSATSSDRHDGRYRRAARRSEVSRRMRIA